MMRLLVVCNPENRRVRMLDEAAKKTGWSLKTLAYEDLLLGSASPTEAVRGCDAVRVESPGENFLVERELLTNGALIAGDEGFAIAAKSFHYELGRIHSPWYYFLGFKELIGSLAIVMRDVRWMNAPSAIVAMFDKVETKRIANAAGIPTPADYGIIRSFDQLCELLETQHVRRAFVKFATSSSASGVIAIRKHGEQMCATTTVETDYSSGSLKLYNSLRLHTTRDLDEIRQLINALVPYRIFAEAWLPKAAYDHRSTFDLRVLSVNGTATHIVPRVSDSPITNLHLGNRRGDWEEVQLRLGPACDNLRELCAKTTQAIEGTFYSGLDIVVDPSNREFHLLEANACGDLLPGLTDSQGRDTYTVELQAFRESLLSA